METQKKYENRIKELLKSIAFEDDQLYETISLSEILKNRYVETSQLTIYFSQDSNCYPFYNNDIQETLGLSDDSFNELKMLLKESSKFICFIEGDKETQIRIILENFFTNQNELQSSSKSQIIESIIGELKTITTNSTGASQYQRYDKILDKIKKVILSKSKKKFVNPDKSILDDSELNNIAERISNQILKIKFNSDPAGYPRSMEKAKKQFIKNEEIVATPVTEIEKETRINELVENIIDYIIYQKAKSTIQVTISNSQKTVFINDIVMPIELLSKVINKLKTTILPSAFENINIYLTSSETEFLDEFYRKYILHLDDTHILGIENTDNFLKYLNLHKENIKTKIENMESRIDSSKVSNPLNFGTNVITSIGPKILKEAPYLIYAKLMPKKFDETPTTESDIKKQIKTINIIQNHITEIMNDQRESSQIERLIYLLSKKNITTIENISFEENQKKSPKNSVTKAIEEKTYFLGNDFYRKYMTDEVFYNRVNQSIQSITEQEKNRIKKYYEELDKIQKFLNYKYKDVSRAIVKHIAPEDWDTYFARKHDISLSETSETKGSGKIDNTKIGPYGIAQLLIEDEIYEYETNLNNATDVETTIFNILKICDKTYYLSNFNYITDVKRIFIIDNQNSNSSNHIICEMDALNETLMAYYNGVNENGVACFYSIQNTEEIWWKDFKESHLGKAVNFKGKNYATILVFEKPGKDQIITQNYNRAKKSIGSIDDFIQKLNSGEIRLRTATSLNVEGDYEKDNRKINSNFLQKIKHRQNILRKEEANELYLISCSNADYMIQNMTLEEAKIFTGIEAITIEELDRLKLVLSQKNLENLYQAASFRINDLTNEKNMLIALLVRGNENSKIKKGIAEIEEEIRWITDLLRLISNTREINNEIILEKDMFDNDIHLSSANEIEEYFENRRSDFTSINSPALIYLAQKADEYGNTQLAIKIMEYCFNLQLRDAKSELERKEARFYDTYKLMIGQTSLVIDVPRQIKQKNITDAINWYDEAVVPIKKEIIERLSDLLDQFKGIVPNSSIYTEHAEKELSDVIKLEGSTASKITYQIELEKTLKNNKKKLIEAISMIAQDSTLEPNDKSLKMIKECLDFEKNNRDLKVKTTTESNALVEQCQKTKRDIFDEVYQNECSVEFFVEMLIREFKNEIQSLKSKYELHGGYYFEQDLGDMETVLKISEKRTDFIKKLNQKSSVYRVSIWKIYESLVANNATLSNNKKEDLRQYIILRMAQTIREIEGKTGSKLFSQGLAEFNKDSSNPNMDEDISRETLEQISNLEGRDNSHISGPKL